MGASAPFTLQELFVTMPMGSGRGSQNVSEADAPKVETPEKAKASAFVVEPTAAPPTPEFAYAIEARPDCIVQGPVKKPKLTAVKAPRGSMYTSFSGLNTVTGSISSVFGSRPKGPPAKSPAKAA